MDTLYFEQKLEAVDFSVIDEISVLDSTSAFSILEKELTHPSDDVRELSILVLEKRQEERAVELMLKSIVDKDESVQLAAIRALAKRPSKRVVSGLREALLKVDTDIQAEIVLLLGMCGDTNQKEFLQQLLMKAKKEDAGELVHNLDLALARLGDFTARNSIINNLASDRVEYRRDALYDFEYINDPMLLIKLKPLLIDPEVAIDIGKGPSHIYLRICDLAVIVANKVLGHPFSFAERGRQFTEEERQIVAFYIERHCEKK